MSKATSVIVEQADDGIRLDRWFQRHYAGIPYGQLSKLIRTGQVRVDGARAKAGDRIEAGQTLRLPPQLMSAPAQMPQSRRLSDDDVEFVQGLVIHKDKDVLVLNKPPGLAVQGGTKTDRHIDGLLDGLKFELDQRPKLVHRLDRDTSGLLVLARHAKSAAFLTRAFRDRTTRKVYWALCAGVPRPANGLIDLPLLKEKGRTGTDFKERTVPSSRDNPDARPAQTYYAEIERAAQSVSWLALMPVTGRTHQLRVHCAAIGHPIIGDYKYGGDRAIDPIIDDDRPALHLHARSIEIPHPSGHLLRLEAALPAHMARTWKTLEFSQKMTEDPFAGLDL